MSWELDTAALRTWSRVDNARSVTQIGLEIALVAAAVWACQRWWNPALYVATIVWIGARQHALLVLMHDAAHARLLTSRRWNDIIGELLAWPLGITMHGFRRSHLAHHHHLGTDDDPDLVYWRDAPDYRFPMTPARLGVVLTMYTFGLRTVDQLRILAGYALRAGRHTVRAQNASDQPGVQRARIACYVALLAAITILGLWRGFLLYWIVPAFTWLAAILYFRSAVEHYALDGSRAPLRATRTVVLGAAGRWLVAPNGINLHLEHHLYPSVPFHRLPRLHAHLTRDGAYRAEAHVTAGLLAACRELTGRRAARA